MTTETDEDWQPEPDEVRRKLAFDELLKSMNLNEPVWVTYPSGARHKLKIRNLQTNSVTVYVGNNRTENMPIGWFDAFVEAKTVAVDDNNWTNGDDWNEPEKPKDKPKNNTKIEQSKSGRDDLADWKKELVARYTATMRDELIQWLHNNPTPNIDAKPDEVSAEDISDIFAKDPVLAATAFNMLIGKHAKKINPAWAQGFLKTLGAKTGGAFFKTLAGKING